MSDLQKTIARTFLEMAEGLESGSYGPRPQDRADRYGQRAW